jgi:hypothetical protein
MVFRALYLIPHRRVQRNAMQAGCAKRVATKREGLAGFRFVRADGDYSFFRVLRAIDLVPPFDFGAEARSILLYLNVSRERTSGAPAHPEML